jgi:hypothetical protein
MACDDVIQQTHRIARRLLTALVIMAIVSLLACSPEPDPQPIGSNSSGAGGVAGQVTGAVGGAGGPTDPQAGAVAPAVCGDGIISSGEECEGNDTGGATCAMRDAGSGSVTCNANACQLDFSQCYQNDSGTSGIGGSGGDAGTGGVAGSAGTTDTAGTGGIVPVQECTPNQAETIPCGTCGEQTRTCSPDGMWGEASVCDDPCANVPACVTQTQVPTWDSNVGVIVQTTCGGCHAGQANQYATVKAWAGFDLRIQMGHYIASPNSDVVKCWIGLGKPQN